MVNSKKKGQIAIFIIIVIGLFVFVGSLLYLLKTTLSNKPIMNDNAQEVNTYTTNCVTITLENAIKTSSLLGGTDKNGEVSSLDPDVNTSANKKTSNPPEAELFIANYIKEHLNDCLDNYRSFDSKGVKVVSGEIKNVEVSINNQDTSVTVTFPIKVISGSKTTTIEKFQASKPSELIRMLEKEKNTFANEEIDMTYLGSTRQNTTVLD